MCAADAAACRRRGHACCRLRSKDSKAAQRRPTEREVSQRKARENAEAARDTRKSHRPGVDDDSEIVRSMVGTLGVPVEGALDSIRERERAAARGQDPGPDQVGGVSGQRAADVRHYDRDAKVPTRPDDAEAEPQDIAEDMTRDRPGARGRR